MTGSASLVTVLVVPLAGAVAALLAGQRGAAAASLLTSALGVAAAFALAAEVMTGGMQHVAVGGWAVPLGIELRADGLAAAMLLITAVIGAGISVFAWRYFGAAGHHDLNALTTGPPGPAGEVAPPAPASTQWLFWPVWLLAWGALNALYLSGDLFNIYVTLELLGLAAVALVALAGAGAAAAALRYLLFALLGSMLYILGVELL